MSPSSIPNYRHPPSNLPLGSPPDNAATIPEARSAAERRTRGASIKHPPSLSLLGGFKPVHQYVASDHRLRLPLDNGHETPQSQSVVVIDRRKEKRMAQIAIRGRIARVFNMPGKNVLNDSNINRYFDVMALTSSGRLSIIPWRTQVLRSFPNERGAL